MALYPKANAKSAQPSGNSTILGTTMAFGPEIASHIPVRHCMICEWLELQEKTQREKFSPVADWRGLQTEIEYHRKRYH